MIRLSRFLLAASVLALSACRGDRNEEIPDVDVAPTTEPAPPVSTPTPMPTTPVMTAPITGETGTNISGQVQIMPVDGDPNGFRVVVNMQGVPEGEHAWHIHQGACSAKNTPVVVPITAEGDKPAIGTPLMAGADGNVTAEVTVPSTLLSLQQLQSADYSLHAHRKGGTDAGPSIACANL
jgi:Cu/Zn superoxide dismutase